MDDVEIRRRNLDAYIREKYPKLNGEGNRAAFCRAIGMDPTYLNRMFAAEGKEARAFTADKAREIEQKVGLTRFWLERRDDDSPAAPQFVSNVLPFPMKRRPAPIISLVAASEFREIGHLPEVGEGDEWETPDNKLGERGWCCIVDGPSMDDGSDKAIPAGWLIFCDPDLSPFPNAFVIAKQVDSQKATFKQLVHEDGRWYLRPLNRQFPVIEIDDPAMRVIAVVTEARPRSRRLV